MNSGIFNRSKLKLKWVARDLGHWLGLAHEPKGYFSTTLVYHGIDNLQNTRLNSRFISETTFRTHVRWMTRHCNVLPAGLLFPLDPIPQRPSVAITFDDGYLNNFNVAVKVAEEFDMPITLFITPLYGIGHDIHIADLLDLVALTSGKDLKVKGDDFRIDPKGEYVRRTNGDKLKPLTKQMLPDDLDELRVELEKHSQFRKDPKWDVYWKLISKDQIRELADHRYVSIGSHGLTHANLAALPDKLAREELAVSKSILEETLDQAVSDFAYPFGTYSDALLDLAKQCGYSTQFGVDLLRGTDEHHSFLIPRLGINPHISWTNQKIAIAEGGYF